MEDLDQARSRPLYAERALLELGELGIVWEEGPDVGGPYEPYNQSERISHYLEAWKNLQTSGSIYPCRLSRKDVEGALLAPHGPDGEAIFPLSLRAPADTPLTGVDPGAVNWRFAVPYGETISFTDLNCGPQTFVCGEDLGDFLVWRKDGYPSYELAVVVDDAQMKITEVVRGRDLLLSTARQLLLYRALGLSAPDFFHTDLVLDDEGKRLSKRNGATALASWLSPEHRAELNRFLSSGSARLPL